MKKLNVTYKAPQGDSKVVEAFGHTFFDGKAEEVTVEDAIAERIMNNRLFHCGKATDADAHVGESKPGPKPGERSQK